MKPSSFERTSLAIIQVVMAYEWFTAGWEKVSSPDFVQNIGKTLAAFASKNPFAWYKAFLEGPVTANAMLFAYAIEWTQIVIALTLAASAAYVMYQPEGGAWTRRLIRCAVFCLAAGAVMNANFYFAAGWTGPGTKGVNVVMFWTQVVLMYAWLKTALRRS